MLFHQEILLQKSKNALLQLAEKSNGSNCIIVVGAPIRYQNAIYNCAIVIQSGQIRGVVPKSFLPNYKEFYEKLNLTGTLNLEEHYSQKKMIKEKMEEMGEEFTP